VITDFHPCVVSTESFARLVRRSVRWVPVLALAVCSLSYAQSWPTKPIRIVVPFSPGGTTDQIARVIGKALSQGLGQPVVVDSKPGASGAIGAIEVARAPADGYTFLVATSSTHAVAPALVPNLRYNAVEDFTPIALLAQANTLLLVSPSVEAKNMQELIEMARKKPGYFNYTSSGVGSFAHLCFELLKARAGIDITHIPYKGTGSAIPDLLSGNVHMSWDSVPSGIPHVKEGKLRAFALSGARRTPLAPGVPTMQEVGVRDFDVWFWVGLYAPRGLPPELTRRVNEEINKAMKTPEMLAQYERLGVEAAGGSSADFAAFVAKDYALWSRIVKDSKLKPE